MEKPNASFFLMDFVLLVLGVAFILSVFKLSGFFFILQLVLLLVFLGILVVGMAAAYSDKKSGWTVIAATLVLIALDLFFMFIISGQFGASHFATLVSSLIGLVIALISIGTAKEQQEVESFEGEYYPNRPQVSEMNESHKSKEKLKQEVRHEVAKESEEIKKELREGLHEIKQEIREKDEEKIEKTFVPGKYIASRKANKFHSPKCDWANRIKRGNEIWFQSKEEAKDQGFEADECV